MGNFWEDAGDNITAFFSGSTPEKIRASRQRVNNYKQAAKPLPSIQNDLRNKQALAVPSTRLPEDVIKAAVDRNKETATPSTYANKMQSDEASYTRPSPPTLMESLMDRISGSYQPQMPPGMAGAADANKLLFEKLTGQIDSALASKLGAIGNVRNTAQQNFNTSDHNLAAMFGANANNIATQGSQRFNDIAAQSQAGINAQRDASLSQLKGNRNEAMDRRTEMLQRLGIQAAGAQADPGEATLNNAISATTNRADMALQGSQQANATNQAYNQSVVNSVNQQGGERRAALMQQLQNIQNRLGMAEAEANDAAAGAKSQLEIQRLQAEQKAQPTFDEYNKFGYQQFKDDRGLAFDLYKTMLGQQDKAAQATQQAPRVQGYAGLAQDLINQNIPPEQAGQYMGALSQVLGSEYMKGIHPDEGYDRASVIARRLMEEMQVPPAIAAQLATNYANLGNNAYYTQQ